MIYLWITGELAAIAAICGLVAGNAPDRAKLTRNFLWLTVIGVVMALVLAAVTYYRNSGASEPFEPWIFQRQWCDSGDAQYSWLLPLDYVPKHLIWSTGAIGIGLIWLSGLLAFYCRSMAPDWRTALLGVIVGGPLLLLASVFGFFGICAWVVLMQRVAAWGDMPVNVTGIVLAVLAGLVTSLFVLYAFWGKRRGWKVLAMQLGIGAGVYLLCWLSALAAAAGFSQYLKHQAASDGITACHVLKESLPEIVAGIKKIQDFDKQHPLFELPVNSIYDWNRRNDDDKNLVPAAAREYTLQFFKSPEALEYYQWYENIADVEVPPDVQDFRQLTYLRALARVCVGRAALYCETGETDKILPQLMRFIRYDRQNLAGRPYIINEMVRVACRMFWSESLVSLGPDGPQYTPYYRQALDYLKAQKLYLPNEAGAALGSLAEIKVRSFTELLILPPSLASTAKKLAYFLSIRSELQKLETDGWRGEVLPWDNSDYGQLAAKSEVSLLLGRTGVALKLYRSLEGKYPATLAELVPKYLDETPVSPFADVPLVYQPDGDGFTLSIKEPSSKYANEVTTQKEY